MRLLGDDEYNFGQIEIAVAPPTELSELQS